MKRIKTTILLIATSMLLCACPDKEEGHSYITIVNKSERNIACQMFWSGHITEADTLYQCRIPAVGISVDSQYNFSSGNSHKGKGWEEDFKAIPYIQFLIMDGDIYKEYHY